jgi:hypothetical protein
MINISAFEAHFERNRIILTGRFIYHDIDSANTLLLQIRNHANELGRDEHLEVTFFADYYCTWMRKRLVAFFNRLADINRSVNKCSVNLVWGYDYDDEDVFELGEALLERSGLPVKYLSVENEIFTDLGKRA